MKLTKTLLILSALLFNQTSYAIESSTRPLISDGVAIERIQAYARSSTKSEKLGIVEPDTILIEHKNLMKTKPGLAYMNEKPKSDALPFDRGAPVQIWEYLDHGFSRIVLNNVAYTAKIARSTDECSSVFPKRNYCWAKVVTEPEYYEWKNVSLTQDGEKFWVLNRIIDASGVISVKDENVSQTRLVSTDNITAQQLEARKKAEKDAEKERAELEAKSEKDSKALFSPEIINDVDLPKDPFARKFVENMMKPKSVKKAEKEAQNKKDAEAELKANEAERELTHDEIFQQQDISIIQETINSNSTKDTIRLVNEPMESAPTEKLILKANQPLEIMLDGEAEDSSNIAISSPTPTTPVMTAAPTAK